jgi:uncharacterized membrane protein YuzA (DUF378 family)
MSAPAKRPAWLLAAFPAIAVGSFIWYMVIRFGHSGGDGPDFWGVMGNVTQLPGAVLGDRLFGDTSRMVYVVAGIGGIVECFVVFWGCIALFRSLYARKAA